MKSFKPLLATMIMLTHVANADVVNLTCTIDIPGQSSVTFKTNLEEKSGQVTHVNTNGNKHKVEGFFSIDEVSYRTTETVMRSAKITEEYTINRSDLTLNYRHIFDALGKSSVIERTGVCDIYRPQKERKF